MPFENEHSCRLIDPDDFEDFRRQNGFDEVDGKRIDAIFGIDGDDSQLQALRYPTEDWDEDGARENCMAQDGILFEPAQSESAVDLDAIDKLEFFQFPGKVKDVEIKDIDLGKGEVLAYGAAFGNTDADGDVIERGTFAESIARHGPEGSDRIRILYQHDPYTPIGRPMSLEEDDHGLKLRYSIAGTTVGKDALKLLDEGVINEHSVGMSNIERSDEDRSRIVKARLWEVSPVTWGANPLTPALQIGKDAGSLDHFVRELKRRMSATRKALRRGLTEETAEKLSLQLRAIEKIAQPLEEAAETKDSAGPKTEDPVNQRAKEAVERASSTIERLYGAVRREDSPGQALQSAINATDFDI